MDLQVQYMIYTSFLENLVKYCQPWS